jgi:hypothetical protein
LAGCRAGGGAAHTSAHPEPAGAAGFIAAHADGDPAALEAVVSPLLRHELTRRAVTDRAALLPWWRYAAERLEFAHVGAVVDGHGFTHALYLAHPRGWTDGAPPRSVWRVDLDQQGRVLWAEGVRVFAPGTMAVSPIVAADDDARAVEAAVDADAPGRSPRLLLGVGSPEGEGYYALGVDPNGDTGTPRPAAVLFVAIDRQGTVLPGAWSYGRPPMDSTTVAGAWSDRAASATGSSGMALVEEDETTRSAYLAALCACAGP